VLEIITAWIHDKEGPQIYWLNGLAGTGKSTIAESVAQLAAKDGLLGASFFCLRDEVERSDTSLIFPSLALQLSDTKPLFRTVTEPNPSQQSRRGRISDTLYPQISFKNWL
jgi:hypothetical protein